MLVDENRTIVLRFFEEVLNQGSFAALSALVDAEAVNQFRQALNMTFLYTAFSQLRFNVAFTVGEGETVVSLCYWTGIHSGVFQGIPPSGKKVHVQRIDVFRLARGKIVSNWYSSDNFSLLRQLEAETSTEPVLEVKEIQGNSLAGFNKNYQTFLFIKIVEPTAARAWLRHLLPNIATLEEVISFNRLYKELRRRRGGVFGAIQATWMNIALSYDGLSKLTPEAELFTDRAFKEGIHRRSAQLGDATEAKADGNPQNWLVGGPHNVADIILIVASDDQRCVKDEVTQLRRGLNGGLNIIFEQQGSNPPEPLTGHEHFGFRDGISQPGVRGRLSNAPDDFLTPRQNPDNPNQGKPGQDLIWPGEFVFGYPTQDPADQWKPGPIAEAGPSWGRNGSFLVFRRFRQDVSSFRQFLQSEAQRLVKTYPELADLTAEKLSAKLMGRWPSGAPLLRAPEVDLAEIAKDNCADNHFDFIHPSSPIKGGPSECTDNVFPQSPGDEAGLICPHAAHIRKTYPRDDPAPGGRAAVDNHRIIRRGIPFGKPFPERGERGLLFLAYQTSIERQFEFIMQHWSNNPNFRDLDDGFDPIIGQTSDANSPRAFTLPVDQGNGKVTKVSLKLATPWVIPTGGGYFFSPSISALQFLCRDRAD